MLTLQPKQVNIFLLVSICLCGLSAGYFTAQFTGAMLQPSPEETAAESDNREVTARPERVDIDLILQKNIFNPAARGAAAEPEQTSPAEPVATSTRSDLKLIGTVDGGGTPLALIQSGGKVKVYKVGAQIPGGGELLSVARNEAIVLQPGGDRTRLTIVRPEGSSSPAAAQAPAESGIRAMGNNRWSVARDEVEKARANLNQLLKSARLEPNIINGQTEGFVVKMIRPKSLLAELGIRRGDTITRVNSVELNSPEKALQIFQQLREAKRLTVDLKRGNENLTFEYEVN